MKDMLLSDLTSSLFLSVGNLHFLNVSEISGNKTYACGIWNERINKLVKGNSMTLNIKGLCVLQVNAVSES